ncbi:MAG: SurA N-terminal domain-containing protein [Roseovarius sp.]
MAGKSITKPLVWILMGLLIVGLGGFGATNFGGTIRSIGSVGDAEIGTQDYARGLQQEIRAIEAERGEAVSFNEARGMGATEAVLTRLVASAAFDHEAMQLGLSIGDENLRDEILAMQQFRGLDGEFDREAYSFALEQAGLSEAEFEEDIRREASRSLLQGAVMAGARVPEAYIDTLMTYLGERRDISWALLTREDLQTGVPVPDEADLEAYHSENEEQFTLPELKRITYAWLTPEMLLDTVEIDEAALREAYEAREAEFNIPERRLVERLVYPDMAAAEAARARLDTGEAGFEDLVEARGLELADTDMGDVTKDELDGAGEVVFSTPVGEVAGPVETALGPAFFRVNAILSAQSTSFVEAEPELRDELARDRAIRVIETRIEAIDDLLAGGATIEDLARETHMQMGQIDWHQGMSADIGAYTAFRAAAEEIATGDYPEVMELEDGGIFAMRLDEVVPPRLQPLDTVRDAVAAAWEAEAIAAELKKQAEPLVSQVESEGLEAAGLTVDGATALTRRGVQPDMPRQLVEMVFGLEEGGVALIEGDARLFVVKLDSVTPPDETQDDLAQLRSILQNQAAQGVAQDLFQVLANDIRTRAGIELDQSAINAVHANFQ